MREAPKEERKEKEKIVEPCARRPYFNRGQIPFFSVTVPPFRSTILLHFYDRILTTFIS